MLDAVLALIAGSLLLAWGADRFVAGAAALARWLGVSALVVGVVLVGFATSFPEMLVSAFAAINGNTGLSVGNALGSCIINISVVLGITALIIPLNVHSKLLSREFPLLFVAIALDWWVLSDERLARGEALIMLAGLIGAVVALWWLSRRAYRRDVADPLIVEVEKEHKRLMSPQRALMWLVVGLGVLLLSARMLVWGGVIVAHYFGVSDLVIGLTVVALGTSLPELAASIAAAFKHEHDIAVGNIVGSNLFNLLGVLAMPGLLRPGPLDGAVLWRDFPVMFGFSALFFIFVLLGIRHKALVIHRYQGAILLTGFGAYLWLLLSGV